MQFKAELHCHTTWSDGEDPLWSVIERFYRLDFDILAITDHNTVVADWRVNVPGIVPGWGHTRQPAAVSHQRFAEIAAGVGRGGKGMLMIPLTNEHTFADHLNSFFVNYIDSAVFTNGPALTRALNAVQTTAGGLAHANHLGWPTTTNAGVDPPQANNITHINRWRDLFLGYSSLVGMEICSHFDGSTANDRVFWDNINQRTIPQGKIVWGFCNSDAHGNWEATGLHHNMMLMSANTLSEFQRAMIEGTFYGVSRLAWREGVNGQNPGIPTPVIDDVNINLSNRTITIRARHYDRVDWITEGTVTIATGDTINLNSVSPGVFVRANVVGPGGIAFIQPIPTAQTFGLSATQLTHYDPPDLSVPFVPRLRAVTLEGGIGLSR